MGVNPASAGDWDALIRAGMAVQSAEALKEGIAVPDSLLAERPGVGEKAPSRARACKGRLDPVTSDRLFRVARFVTLAIEVPESEAAALRWLKRPRIGLGDKTLLALLATDPGCDQVGKRLLRIEHGVHN